jgi:GNAT superfamily N-acetyltransferase
VTRVWRACERHDDGEPLFTEEDLVAVWKRPSLDPERHTIGVRDGDALVAHALLFGERDAFACVLPSHRGRGIGRWLLRWTQDAGRAAGNAVTSQSVSERNHGAAALLEADGFAARWRAWFFDLELAAEPAPPVPPDGYAIAAFEPGRDDRAVHRLIADAFGEWPEHDADTFEDWVAQTLGRPGFRPEHIARALCGTELAGAAVMVDDERVLWVDQLAVAPAHRGRGVARALLTHAFGVGWRTGHRHVGLATDSRTGARGLYEHVGMHVTRTYVEYSKPL